MKALRLTSSGTSSGSVSGRRPPPSAPERRPRLWPWLIVLVASAGVLSAVGWEIWPWVSGVALAPPPRTPAPLAAPAAPGRVRVRIFFPDEARQGLREEEREIIGWLTLQAGVQHLLAQLAVAQAGARPPLPPGTTLRYAYLDDAGILYLDFNAAIQPLAGGDWMKADLASSAVGLTLAANLGEVKRIQFLADGTELTLLSGGMDFRRPFIPRFPGEAAAEATQR